MRLSLLASNYCLFLIKVVISHVIRVSYSVSPVQHGDLCHSRNIIFYSDHFTDNLMSIGRRLVAFKRF